MVRRDFCSGQWRKKEKCALALPLHLVLVRAPLHCYHTITHGTTLGSRVTLAYRLQPIIQEVRVDTKGRDMEAVTGAEAMEDCHRST